MFWIITILILLVVGAVLLPGAIIAYKVHSLKRNFTKQYSVFVNQQQQQRDKEVPKTDTNHHKKVIDDSVGEYVEFEDIPEDEYVENEYAEEGYCEQEDAEDEYFDDEYAEDEYYSDEYESEGYESEEYYYDDESQVEDAEWEDI